MTSDSAPAAVPSAEATSVLLPSRAAYARAFRANLWLAIPLLVISVIRIGFNPWLLPVLLAAILLSLGGVMLYFRNARIEYRDGAYTVIGMFRQRRTFQAAQVKVLVTITSLQSVGLSATSPQLLAIGEDDRKILRLRGQTWEVEQFTQLALDLIARGVANDAIREPITPARLKDRYPKAVSWWEAHPIAVGLLLGVVLLAVIVAVVLAVALTMG
ncbi:MAG TPA: hypothetical protein VGM70_11375 [Pseudolysinimonas sp.]